MAEDLHKATYCRVCGFAVERLRSTDGRVTYVHLRREHRDHEPDPVAIEDLDIPARTMCDFCSAPDPAWVYPTEQVVTREASVRRETVRLADYRSQHHAARVTRTSGDATFGRFMGQWWATCVDCAPYVDARDHMGLLYRAVASLPAKYRRADRIAATRAEILQVYVPLFEGVIGEPVPNPYLRPTSP